MLIIEFDKRFHRFGTFKSHPEGELFRRVWFGWVAITYTTYNLAKLSRDLIAGKLSWVAVNKGNPADH